MAVRCYGCMRMKENTPVCEHCGYDETAENDTHQLPVGTVVGGQYTLGRVLGQGGFGITYMGWDNVLQIPVAVKEYFPSGYAGRDPRNLRVSGYNNRNARVFENNKARFLREADSLAKLWEVPQIVRILRHFEDNGTAYIAMEYVRGCDLRSHLRQLGRPMTPEEVLDILGPVMEALSQVHKLELVHRDISPDNIMVLPEGGAKLLDFGAARYVENADAEHDRNTSTQAILKHGFAPPEQYQSHGALGPWTDIYAMCATVLYCLTGRVPQEAMNRILEGDRMDLQRIPGLTREQRSALEKGMALQPKARFRSMEELYRELWWQILEERELEEEEKEEAQEEAFARSDIPEKWKKRLTAAIAAVLVMGAVLLASMPKRQTASAGVTRPAHQAPAQTLPPREELPRENQETLKPYGRLVIEEKMYMVDAVVGSGRQVPVLSEHAPEELSWSSSDPLVAEVSQDGTVTARGYGAAVITAGLGPEQVSCQVTVSLRANGEYRFYQNEDGLTISGYTGQLPKNLVIPSRIQDVPVTEIGVEAFDGAEGLVSVAIPDSVLRVGDRAFRNCPDLKSASIAQGVRTIGSGCFSNCTALEAVSLPQSLTALEGKVFSGCQALSVLSLPPDLTQLGESAFYKTGITAVTIPSGIRALENSVFRGCAELTEVTLSRGLETVGEYAFAECHGLKAVRLPASVTGIGKGAFYSSKGLETVSMQGVTAIGDAAFSKCASLKQADIPAGCTYLGRNAFSECVMLKSVTVPGGLTYFGEYAFYGCSGLKDLNLSGGLETIPSSAFSHCDALEKVTIPNGVKTVGMGAFDFCKRLKSVTIPQSVITIRDDAFRTTGLQYVRLPENCAYTRWGLHRSFPENCTVTLF